MHHTRPSVMAAAIANMLKGSARGVRARQEAMVRAAIGPPQATYTCAELVQIVVRVLRRARLAQRAAVPALCLLVASVATAQSATYLSADVTTQGAWKGHYGSLGFNLYPEGSVNDPVTWVKGAGTQYRANGVQFDPALPQRNGAVNCCDPVTYTDTRPGHAGTFTVKTGDPWPPDARLWTGFYHRADAPGQKMRIGLSVPVASIISFYLVDWDRWGRIERISLFADSGIPVNEPGSLGQATQNGALLDTRVITDFEGGKYVRWRAQGHIIVQFEAVGTTPEDAPSVAVESGIFADPIQAGCPVPPTQQIDAMGTWSLGAPAEGGFVILLNGLPYVLGGAAIGYYYDAQNPNLYAIVNDGRVYSRVPNGQWQKMDYDPRPCTVTPLAARPSAPLHLRVVR